MGRKLTTKETYSGLPETFDVAPVFVKLVRSDDGEYFVYDAQRIDIGPDFLTGVVSVVVENPLSSVCVECHTASGGRYVMLSGPAFAFANKEVMLISSFQLTLGDQIRVITHTSNVALHINRATRSEAK